METFAVNVTTGKQAQNRKSETLGFGIGFQEFGIFQLLGVHHANQRGTEDTLVDDLVQPVDHLAALYKQCADFLQGDGKHAADNRDDGKHR